MSISSFIWRHLIRRISGASIGIVVNHDTDGDLGRLRTLARPNRLPLVRTTNLGDPESAQRVLALSAEDYPVLVMVPFGKGFGPVGAGMALQIDDEPDIQSPAVSPEHYGETFRSTMQAMRKTLPSSIPIVTAGFSNTATADWIQRALVAGAGDADAICFHIAGDDLAAAFTVRLDVAQAAMAAADCTKPLWITSARRESAQGFRRQGEQLRDFLKLPALRAVERIYIHALSTDPASGDFSGICDHDLSRTPRPAFDVVRKAIARP